MLLRQSGTATILSFYTVFIMLVHALLLRRQGIRRSPEELKASTPLIGRLRLRASHYEGRDGRGRQVCLLMPVEEGVQPIVELFSARLLRIEDRGVLIGGEEEFWNRKRRATYTQVIWAWPLPPPAKEPVPHASIGSPKVRRLLEALDAIA